MIDSLAALVGLGAQDPAFWMPLALMVVFFCREVAGSASSATEMLLRVNGPSRTHPMTSWIC